MQFFETSKRLYSVFNNLSVHENCKNTSYTHVEKKSIRVKIKNNYNLLLSAVYIYIIKRLESRETLIALRYTQQSPIF